MRELDGVVVIEQTERKVGRAQMFLDDAFALSFVQLWAIPIHEDVEVLNILTKGQSRKSV